MTFMDGLFRNLKTRNIAKEVKYILEVEEFDSDSLIEDVTHYSNLLKLLNDDQSSFNLIKGYVHDYQGMV